MRKIFTLISLAFVAFSCSNELVTEVAEMKDSKEFVVTVTANGDGTSTRVSMDNSDVYASTWSAAWEDGDALAAWVNYDSSITAFSMSDYDMEASSFTGDLSTDADSVRFVYPYSTTASVGSLYPISVASQTDGLSSIYLVSEELVSVSEEAGAAVAMKQVGAFVVLTASFTNAPEDMVISSVELCDVPTSLSIDLTKKVDEEGFYGESTTGNIKVSGLDFTVGGDDLQICFNVLPFDITSGSSLNVKFNYVANGVGYTATATLTNSTGADLSIVRATHNYITATCDCSSASIVEDGTADGPYLLYTVDDLKSINSNLSAHYTLMNDLDLDGSESNQWTPIGSSSAAFTGTFNGGFNTIMGLYINSASTHQGLFGYISSQATVKNVAVEGSVTSTNSYVGGIVGYALNSKDSEPNIVMNCINRAEVKAKSYAGGVVGYTKYPCYIISCGNEANVSTTTSMYAGGIAPYLYTSMAINCYNLGDIYSYSYNAGGLVAYATSTSSVYNSYSAGTVSGSSNSRLGSVVSNNISSGSVIDCYWDNQVSSVAAFYSDLSSVTVVTGMSTSEMQAEDFVTTLNANVAKYNAIYDNLLSNWKYNEGGYPVLDLGFDEKQIEGTTGGVTFEN